MQEEVRIWKISRRCHPDGADRRILPHLDLRTRDAKPIMKFKEDSHRGFPFRKLYMAYSERKVRHECVD